MRSRLTLLPLTLLLAVAAGCQLCGLQPARCVTPGDDYNACGPDDYCGDDGFCRPVTRAPLRGTCAERAEATEVRRLGIGVGTGGAEAMGDSLYGVEPALSCGPDAIACGLEALGSVNHDVLIPVTLRGASDPDTTTSLDTVAFRSASAPLELAGGFVLEVIFRSPSAPVAAPIVAMSDGVSGWELGMDSAGYLGFAVGDQVLGLSYPALRTWHHVLCRVDVASLQQGGDDDDILCVVDGTLLQSRFAGEGASPLFDGPLTIGAYDDGMPVADSAVAALRLWAGDPLAAAATSSELQDALVDEANARLARFHGIDITAPSETLRIARLGYDFFGLNLKLQPLTRAGVTSYEVVPARWPRTAFADPVLGMLIERFTEDQVDPARAVLACYDASPSGVPTSGPDGVHGACNYVDFTVAGSVLPSESFVAGEDDLTFSVFLGRSSDATIRIDSTTCAAVAGILDDSGRGSGSCALQEGFADGFVRLVARASRPRVGATYQASVTGTVWSPQIEIGSDASTPFRVLVADSEGFSPSAFRILDVIALERIGLTRGDSTSAVATVMPLGDLDIGALVLSESVDYVRNLILNLEEENPGFVRGGGELEDDFSPIEMRGPPVRFDDGTPLTFGVDLGTPVVRCGDRCNAGVGAGNIESPGQWEVLKLSGQGAPFVLADFEVSTRGTPPLEIAFELRPEIAPTGCLLGRYPDISLVGCAGGACTEGTTSRVVWTGASPETSPGPGLGELAVAGSLVAERLEIATDALYFEVRFLPGGDGSVLALEDDDGPVVVLAVRDKTLTLERRDVAPSPLMVLNPSPQGEDDTFLPYQVVDGTWVQASCWVGPESACITNMDYLRLFEGPPLETIIRRARAGEAASSMSFVRVWSQPSDTPSVDIIRMTSARVANSFGLGMLARRSPTLVVERRSSSAIVQHDGGPFTVGPAWPRVQLVDGAPAYLSEAGAGEQLGLAFAFDLAGEKRGILEVELAQLPMPGGYFGVVLDAGTITPPVDDYLVLAVASGSMALSRVVDEDTTDREPATRDDVTFDGVSAPSVKFSWRGGIMSAETTQGAVAIREVLQFPLLGYVHGAAFGSSRVSGDTTPHQTGLRHLRLSSR